MVDSSTNLNVRISTNPTQNSVNQNIEIRDNNSNSFDYLRGQMRRQDSSDEVIRSARLGLEQPC